MARPITELIALAIAFGLLLVGLHPAFAEEKRFKQGTVAFVCLDVNSILGFRSLMNQGDYTAASIFMRGLYQRGECFQAPGNILYGFEPTELLDEVPDTPNIHGGFLFKGQLRGWNGPPMGDVYTLVAFRWRDEFLESGEDT